MPVRIVLVDDHKILRDGLRLRLEQEAGFKIVGEAATAAEARQSVEQARPDLVVLDLDLPGEKGLAVAKRFRADLPQMKILVLTGLNNPEAAHEVMLAGAHGYLRKDEASEELVRAIHAVMAGKIFLSPDAATVLTRLLREQKDGTAEPVLNERETTFLRGVADGLSYKEIANGMNLSVKSMEAYRTRLAKKLGCASRADLVRYAVRKGLVAP